MEYTVLPIVIALAELVKSLGLNSKLIPIFNILVSIVLCLIINSKNQIKFNVLDGILIGLSASGMYSTIKNSSELIKSK